VGQKHEKFREFRTPFPPRDIRKNPLSMYTRVSQAMAQFVLKIELLSHIMGTAPILKMARAYGLRPRLWLLLVGENSRQDLGSCGFSFGHYLEKFFNQIYRAFYGDPCWCPARRGTKMAAVK